MDYTEVLNEFAERPNDSVSEDLVGNRRALAHCRDQHCYWSMEARWRGGGPEYRAHCQDQEKFFAGWIVRLEHCQDILLSRVAVSGAPSARVLN